MKKVLTCILILTLFAVAIPQASAWGDIQPLSSINFVRATISVSKTGSATFSARLTNECSTVSITSCTLQKMDEGKWIFAASLTTPPSSSNTTSYYESKDYSSEMTEGVTYRIVATFEADGESVTKTSNSFTY